MCVSAVLRGGDRFNATPQLYLVECSQNVMEGKREAHVLQVSKVRSEGRNQIENNNK